MLELLRGRLSVVVAATGYGKTTAVRRWLRDSGDPAATVFDDVRPETLPEVPPDTERLVLISRWPIPVTALLRYNLGAPVEFGPPQLAMTPRQVNRLLADQYGVDEPAVAGSVHRLTAGWPALVHLAGAWLAVADSDQELDDQLAAPFTPLHEYLCGEVLGDLPPDALELLTHVAELGAMSTELVAGIGQDRLSGQLAWLARLGLLSPAEPGRGWYEPVPLVASVVSATHPLPSSRRRAVVALAAEWHTDHDRPADALRLTLAAGDATRCAGLLAEHGAELLAAGAATEIVDAVRLLPEPLRNTRISLVHGEALQATGDTEGALAAYARLAGDAPVLPAGLAWRYGAAMYLWGDPAEALAIFRRGRADAGSRADEALLLAWTAAAHWLAGNETDCAEFAGRAYDRAHATGDHRAMAAAHVALALCAHLTGDPVGLRAHYGRAMELAEAAGDRVQVLRIRVNLAAGLEQEGQLTEALAVLGPAVELAESGGYHSSLALALANQGALLHRLGRLDDAVTSYQSAVQAYQRMHSKKVAYPLTGLGDVHRLRGQPARARAAYTEALRAATEDGNNRQGMVPALTGLARITAEEDPAAAEEFAERALTHAQGHWVTTALVARAWVAWHRSAASDVLRDAQAAANAAALHRDRSGLAESLEVQAAATDDLMAARKLLTEALSIWTDAQAKLDADRVRVALGRLAGDDPDLRLNGRLAESRLAAAGVATSAPARPGTPGEVEIRVLGGFTVLVGGRPLGPREWQSRKARDLLRILIARRGRPVSRDELADLLWGPVEHDERTKVAHRLAVALSTLRAVLDPRRCAPQDHYILASQKDIAADLGRLAVDVEELFDQVRYGIRLRERGELADAWAVLTDACQAYTGEVFADDPYSDWSRPLREEARATHLRVLRMLVELAQRAGEVDDVVQYLLRILSVDMFDEQAHRDLVAILAEAGRHGEASRAFRRYAEAMREIGVPARDVPGFTRG